MYDTMVPSLNSSCDLNWERGALPRQALNSAVPNRIARIVYRTVQRSTARVYIQVKCLETTQQNGAPFSGFLAVGVKSGLKITWTRPGT